MYIYGLYSNLFKDTLLQKVLLRHDLDTAINYKSNKLQKLTQKLTISEQIWTIFERVENFIYLSSEITVNWEQKG